MLSGRCYSFDNATSFVFVDLSISCESAQYRSLVWYCVGMIIVFPVGVPLFYLLVLFSRRRAIFAMNEGRLVVVTPPSQLPGTAYVHARDPSLLNPVDVVQLEVLLSLWRAQNAPVVNTTPEVGAASEAAGNVKVRPSYRHHVVMTASHVVF
jgi:hypothetical protein